VHLHPVHECLRALQRPLRICALACWQKPFRGAADLLSC
jgi:hypothetical protein